MDSMSTLRKTLLQGLLIAALNAGIADAQTTSTPSAPDVTSSPGATSSPAPTTTPERKNSIQWHNGRGPEYFGAGDYLFSNNSKSEFNRYGVNTSNSWAARGAGAYPVGKLAVMAEGTYDHFQYTHLAGPVTTIGGNGQTFVPTFYAHNVDWDGRVGVGLQYPRVFLVGSYAQRHNNYGYPNLQGVGFGIEKLPDFNEKHVSLFGSYIYYPQFGAGSTLQYGFYKYQAGVEYHLQNPHLPMFAEVGYMGDYGYSKRNAPTNVSDNAIFAGIGVHL